MESKPTQRKPYGITLGDPSGIGAEILLKAHLDDRLPTPFRIFGDYTVLEFYRRKLHLDVDLGRLDCHDPHLMRIADVTPGELSSKAGTAARTYVVNATEAALRGEISAVVTLPMNKEATRLTDPEFTGHTELIGDLCHAGDVTIMLVSDKLIVTHVSTHVSLRTAIERAKRARILKIIELTAQAVCRLRDYPKIAVAGLNPHAGENGLFGDEELLRSGRLSKKRKDADYRWKVRLHPIRFSTRPWKKANSTPSFACITIRATFR